ncbi:hypothetical protein HOLleu_33693 [Holothuria leucospilota]|uniref:Uncharacterized protein n=1 Tax=Holothuria leucospilota TaxID=206669 RepID=A0A9Q0YSA2_HOLLE|nr:hypothetical protein HOLleu_33693 [Holothuria leucospilota]
MENLLSRCLSVFERNSALTQVSTEIREVLGTDDTKLAVKPKTPPKAHRTPAELLNLKLESWDDIIARRLEERKKSPWGRYLISKGAITTNLIQSKQHGNNAGNRLIQSKQPSSDAGSSLVQSKQPVNDAESSLIRSKHRGHDDDSDDEIFVTPASSLTSLHTASSTTSSESLLNIPPMELLEPRPWRTDGGQQTQGQDYSSEKWEQIHEKWRQVFSMSSNWSDETTTFYDSLKKHSVVEKPPEERLI